MSRVEEAIREAQRTGDIKALALAMRRAGVSFADHLMGLRAQIEEASKALKRLERKRSNYIKARVEAAGECWRCAGKGTILVHVHSDRAMIDDGIRECPRCRKQAPKVRRPFPSSLIKAAQAERDGQSPYYRDGRSVKYRAARMEAASIFGPLEDDARKARGTLYRESNPLERVANPATKGALVELTNTRARTYYKTRDGVKGSRVPVGTQGMVFWVEGLPQAPIANPSLGIETPDGQRFFTKRKNLGPIALNGWDRLMGVDSESEAKRQREDTYAETATLAKGDKVTINGKRLSVFWVGPCKRTGRQRFGAGKQAKDGPFWGFSADVTDGVFHPKGG